MNKDEIKLVIFDMDGVILDSEPLHENARQIMFEKYGIVPDASFPDPVGKSASGFWRTVIKICNLDGNPYTFEEEQYRLVAMQIEKNHVTPSDGFLEVLNWAKTQGIEIGLASSSNRILVDDTLRLLDIVTYFDYTVSGDEVNKKKPAPDVYQKVLRMSGIYAEQAVAVEDSSTGIEAAKSAGIFCFGYQNETSGGQNIGEADRVIGHLAEIMEQVPDDEGTD